VTSLADLSAEAQREGGSAESAKVEEDTCRCRR
jgi:hypothetical protein